MYEVVWMLHMVQSLDHLLYVFQSIQKWWQLIDAPHLVWMNLSVSLIEVYSRRLEFVVAAKCAATKYQIKGLSTFESEGFNLSILSVFGFVIIS